MRASLRIWSSAAGSRSPAASCSTEVTGSGGAAGSSSITCTGTPDSFRKVVRSASCLATAASQACCSALTSSAPSSHSAHVML